MSPTQKSPRESVEAFAELAARLSDPFADRQAELAEHGLEEASFAALQSEWCERLAAKDTKAQDLARAFGDTYAASRAKALSPAAPVPFSMSSAAAAPLASAAPEPPAPAKPPPPPEPVRPMAMPSFLKERPAAHSALPSTPMQPLAPQVAQTPAEPPRFQSTPLSPPGDATATGAVDIAKLLKKPVPFDPFAKPTPEALSPSPAEAHPGFRSALSGETADVDIGAIARRVLAFGAAQKSPAPAAQAPAAPAAPPAKVAPPTPAKAAAPAPLTLDHYALLSAEMVLAGADSVARNAVLARFGITNADALTAEWRARFAEDPALSGRWSAAYAAHYARLVGDRAGRR